jgi:hypothetical protein
LRQELGRPQSGSEKKIPRLGAQLASAQQELGDLRREFLGGQAKSEQVVELFCILVGVQELRLKKFAFPSAPQGGIVSQMTAKCRGSVCDKQAVEIIANNICRGLRNAAALGTISYFKSKIWSVDKFITSPVVFRLWKMERQLNHICIPYEIGYPTI